EPFHEVERLLELGLRWQVERGRTIAAFQRLDPRLKLGDLLAQARNVALGRLLFGGCAANEPVAPLTAEGCGTRIRVHYHEAAIRALHLETLAVLGESCAAQSCCRQAQTH